MDAETIRLIITAAAAVVAGLGGATLTAVINRKNTKDTLASARLVSQEQWRQTQDREHALWLRDQKQEAYTGFMLLAQSLQHRIVDTDFLEVVECNPGELEVERGRIKIIGSPTVRTVALALETAVSETHHQHGYLRHKLSRAHEARNERDRNLSRRYDDDLNEALDLYFEARGKFSSQMIQFVEEVRRDLGTVTPGDEALDSENRKLIRAVEDIEKMDDAEKLENVQDSSLA